MLPNFLVLGAQKAGTTTLARFFELHRSIFIPPQRETQFFIHPHLYSKGIAHYETHFFSAWSGEPVVGEKTPEYLVGQGVTSRIAAMLPHPLKFIVCLRSPAARAHAGYRQNLAMARECLSFEASLDLEPSRVARGTAYLTTFGYAARSMYAHQIRNWISAIPDFREQALFVDFDDLVERQQSVLANVAGFLGVEPLNLEAPLHEGQTSTSKCPLSVEGDAVFWRGRRVNSPSEGLVEFARKNAAARLTATPLSRAEEIALNRKLFHKDIKELEVYISRSFSHWLD